MKKVIYLIFHQKLPWQKRTTAFSQMTGSNCVCTPTMENASSIQIMNCKYSRDRIEGRMKALQFLVLDDGSVNFPMIGQVKIGGMKLDDAEDYLEEKYNEFYKGSFVRLRYLNKRVIVLGAPGGQVIPLESENISVIEVVALAGGIDEGGKARNLRLIRGDLHTPQVFQIDLSTINGMKASMMDALPGDIIYVEPTQKNRHRSRP
jgi:protein involved in polysaccharide export with SLBB domain